VKLVTMQELVKKVGYTRQTIYKLMGEGMPVYQSSRRTLFELGAVRGWLRGRKRGSRSKG